MKMTLGETQLVYADNCGDFLENGAEMETGDALRDVLIRARLEDRLTCGVYQAAMKLDLEPERVMLCIHADLCMDDVPLQLHFSLMEAFCWENQIRLLKVGDIESLRKLCEGAKSLPPTYPDTPLDQMDASEQLPRSERAQDFSCVLVEVPEKMDAACTTLISHYDHMAEETPFPHIALAT